MLNMDPVDNDYPDIHILKTFVSGPELDAHAETALSSLFAKNSSEAIRIADNIITKFGISEDIFCRAIYPKPSDIAFMKLKRGYVLPMLSVFGVYNGGMSDAFSMFVNSRFGSGHFLFDICFMDLMVGGMVKKDVPADGTEGASIFPFTPDRIPDLKPEIEAKTRESIGVMAELGLEFKFHPFSLFQKIIMRTKKVPPRYVDYMARLEDYLIGTDKLKRKEWIAVFYDKIVDNNTWLDCLPPFEAPKTIHGPTPPSNMISYVISSVSETVRLLDVNQAANLEIRRFYKCISDLIIILKTIEMGTSIPFGLPSLSSKLEEAYPFGKWLVEIESAQTHATLQLEKNTREKENPTWSKNWW
jgi:hypothetical protein